MRLKKQNLWISASLTLSVVLCIGITTCSAENREPTEADIARFTARLFERSQFSHLSPDDTFSNEFLDRYLDSLDDAHCLFLQSDLDEFASFRPQLAQKILEDGDTGPAHFIFLRYLERLAQRVDFSEKLLQRPFDFTGHDAWSLDRRNAPRPHDLAAAQVIWREAARKDYLVEKLMGTGVTSIGPKLTRRYERQLQSMKTLGPGEVLGIYLDALAHEYDPHSDYFAHPEAENFKIEMNLSLYGIGGSLQVKGGYCVISALVPGGPAARSGLLKPGDRMVEVAQGESEPVDIVGMPSYQVVDLIRGPKGSTVRLTVIPTGAADSIRKTVSLVRDEIKFADAHAKATVVDLVQTDRPPLRIGVIDLPSFYEKRDEKAGGASGDTARLIKKMKREGVAGMILDLRRNGGGSLDEALRLTGLFNPPGPVVQILGADYELKIAISPETNAVYDGPLVVLTSRWSASASEIVAGALQDYGRALILGDSSTFGKGTVQDVVPLKELFHQHGLGTLHLTIGKFYRPSGASTQLKGVVPDIILPSETDLPYIGESKLSNALPWDILTPTHYPKLDLVIPLLADLREKSSARIAIDPRFKLIRQKWAMMERNDEAQSFSLNEAERQRAKIEADAVNVAMKRMALADSARAPMTYPITLSDVDSLGLPASRRPALTSVEADKSGKFNPDEDIELCEAENILADYIHALSSPPGALGTRGATRISEFHRKKD